MSTFRVQWEERSPNAKYANRKGKTVQASSAMEAKAKVRQSIFTNVEIRNMTAVQLT